MNLFDKHQALILKAIEALHERTFFAAFPENPSPANYGENADSEAREKFQSSLGKKFDELKQSNPEGWIGQEESPYTQDELGILYPSFSVNALIERSTKAFHVWRKVSVQDRAGILVESTALD